MLGNKYCTVTLFLLMPYYPTCEHVYDVILDVMFL